VIWLIYAVGFVASMVAAYRRAHDTHAHLIDTVSDDLIFAVLPALGVAIAWPVVAALVAALVALRWALTHTLPGRGRR